MSIRYSKEFKDRAVRLLADSRENYPSETKALQGVARNLGVAAASLAGQGRCEWFGRPRRVGGVGAATPGGRRAAAEQ